MRVDCLWAGRGIAFAVNVVADYIIRCISLPVLILSVVSLNGFQIFPDVVLYACGYVAFFGCLVELVACDVLE